MTITRIARPGGLGQPSVSGDRPRESSGSVRRSWVATRLKTRAAYTFIDVRLPGYWPQMIPSSSPPGRSAVIGQGRRAETQLPPRPHGSCRTAPDAASAAVPRARRGGRAAAMRKGTPFPVARYGSRRCCSYGGALPAQRRGPDGARGRGVGFRPTRKSWTYQPSHVIHIAPGRARWKRGPEPGQPRRPDRGRHAGDADLSHGKASAATAPVPRTGSRPGPGLAGKDRGGTRRWLGPAGHGLPGRKSAGGRSTSWPPADRTGRVDRRARTG